MNALPSTEDVVPPPIPHFIPGWVQLRVRMSDAGGDIINTFSCSPPLSTTRYSNAQLIALAESFRVLWDTYAKPLLSTGVKLIEVTANDLYDELGESGTASWPANSTGTATGESLPANVALTGTAKTRYRGPKYRGRSYLGGFVEAATNGDNVTSAFITAAQILLAYAWTFIGPSSVPVHMVVASRKHSLLTPITAVVVTSIVDTMKRRLTGHGR